VGDLALQNWNKIARGLRIAARATNIVPMRVAILNAEVLLAILLTAKFFLLPKGMTKAIQQLCYLWTYTCGPSPYEMTLGSGARGAGEKQRGPGTLSTADINSTTSSKNDVLLDPR
jgi:hypothetical protein